MKTIKAKVGGMTCSSCEVIIERKLKKLPGVGHVKVSRSKEEAEIECSDELTLIELNQALGEEYTLQPREQLYQPNYSPQESKFFSASPNRFAEIASVLILLFGSYLLLKQFNLIPEGIGVTENMSYGFVFLIGLVAATSTCLAVAGGLLLAVAAKFNEKYPQLTGWQKFKPHLYFNAGRIVSYSVLGAGIGFLGSVLTLSPTTTGFITILASILMIIVGLQLLQIFPWLNRIQIKMPKFIANRIYDASEKDQAKASRTSAFLFGGSTFFLPCGFTQALQLYVLSKGDPIIGGLTMLAFSIGTLPTLVSVGALASFVKGNFQRHFMTFSAVLVIGLGFMNLTPGFTLMDTGFDLPSVGEPGVGEEMLANIPIGDEQVIKLEVVGLDYYPNKFTLKRGVPVKLEIDGSKAQGCGQILSVPKLGIMEQLPRDKIKTIEFIPQETGNIKFSCSMGMAGPGVFEVVA